MLPRLAPFSEPPEGDGWIHEIKHDGYRTLLVINGGQVRAFTRRGHDWSGVYRSLVAAAAKLGCRSATIDGEVIVQDEAGRSDFGALRAAIEGEPHRLAFFAFDLLHLDGADLTDLPLVERREELQRLLMKNACSPIQFSDAIAGEGPAVFAASAGLSGGQSDARASLVAADGVSPAGFSRSSTADQRQIG